MGKPGAFYHGCQGNPPTECAISPTQEFVPLHFFEEFLSSIAIVVDDFVHRDKPIRFGQTCGPRLSHTDIVPDSGTLAEVPQEIYLW